MLRCMRQRVGSREGSGNVSTEGVPMMTKRTRKAVKALVKPAAAAPPRDYGALVAAIGQAHQTAQTHAVQAVNVTLTLRNWLIGYHIFEYEQHGSDRAEYGERLLEHLSQDLRSALGRGFGRRSLEMSRQFYSALPNCEISDFAIRLDVCSSRPVSSSRPSTGRTTPTSPGCFGSCPGPISSS